MSTDLTFFTNEPDATLLDRFTTTLTHVQYFDVLVGYFRTSGFHLLHEALEDVEKIRILVGLQHRSAGVRDYRHLSKPEDGQLGIRAAQQLERNQRTSLPTMWLTS